MYKFFCILIILSSTISAQDSVIAISDENIDVKLFRCINSTRSNLKNDLLKTIDRSVFPVSLLFPGVMFISSRINSKSYDENTAYLIAVSDALEFTLSIGLKQIIRRKRPITILKNIVAKEQSFSDKYSFPSGHSGITFSTAIMYTLRYPKYPQIYLPVYLWAVLSGYGRVYWGMHYPSDVLGGAIIGSASSIFVYSLRKEMISFKNNLFKEKNKPDTGSLNSETILYFLSSFLAVTVFDWLLLSKNQDFFLIYPELSDDSFRLNVRMSSLIF